MRPVWMIRAGLFLYDHLARREVLPGSRTRRPAHAPRRRAAEARASRKGFVYSDGWVDDARLVVLNAHRRRRRAAPTVLTRAACVDAQRDGDRLAGARCAAPTARARTVHGARAGQRRRPVGGAVPRASTRTRPQRKALRLVKGSHIVVPQAVRARPRLHLPEPRQAHHLRDPLRGRLHADRHHRRRAPRRDRRGAHRRRARSTTCASRPAATSSAPVAPADVVWSYSGVRPLLDDESGDPSAVTRDYSLELDTDARRRCSRSGAARSPPSASSPRRPPTCWPRRCGTTRGAWTARRAACPAATSRAWIGAAAAARHRLRALRAGARAAPPRAAGGAARGAWRAPTARASRRCSAAARWAPRSRPACTRPSCDYLHAHEWARSADDVLWRRTKLGLHYDAAERARGGAPGATRTGRSPRRRPRATEDAHGTDARAASSSGWARRRTCTRST